MAIELKKVRNAETLALGFNHEAEIDLSTLGTTAGSATAVDDGSDRVVVSKA